MIAPAQKDYDAVIIGGGPGGSIAGAMLARAGKHVLILEREVFPRFHIGESLIPYGNDVLREAGVWEKVSAGGFMPKLGADFTLANARGTRRFWFGRSLPAPYAKTFQVERARFDQILLDHAKESGCHVLNAKAESFSEEADGVRVRYRTAEGLVEAAARWCVDASGRDAFLGRQMNLPKDDMGVAKKFAIFSHFHNVRVNEGQSYGHIVVVRLEQAWFWIIPLDAEKVSVGMVQPLARFKAAGETPEVFFERTIQEHAELRFRMGNAQRVTNYHSVGDYSYRHHRAAGPRWLLVGDAAGFIDPIFSSGVMMAVKSGRLAARAILDCERRGPRATLSWWAQRRHTRKIRKMMEFFLHMIRAFYDNRSFEVFMAPVAHRQLEQAVLHVLGGNNDLGFVLRWRVRMFYLICRIQHWFRIAPALDYSERKPAPAPIATIPA